MQVLVLAGFIIALVSQGIPPVTASGPVALAALVAYLLGAATLSWANTALSLRAMRHSEAGQNHARKRHNLLLAGTRAWLLGGLAALVLLGYGQWVSVRLGLGLVPLIGELALVAPFVVGIILVWTMDYPFHRAMRQRVAESVEPLGRQSAPAVWTLREYLVFNTRHHLLFIGAPIALILLAKGCLLWAVYWLIPEYGDYVLAIAMPLTAGAIFLLAPLLLVRIWKTTRLPNGSLREELEAACRRFNLTYRQIMIWQSGGVIANAGVIGMTGRLRYILLSDGLLENMDRRDIEAIFAHEAGHIIHHHILYAVLFAVGTIMLAAAIVQQISAWIAMPAWAAEVLVAGLMVAMWGAFFGPMSRRFERQSDVLAAWALSEADDEDPDRITHEGAAVFARALRRVGDLNGVNAHKHDWRHGSIAKRVGYILWLGGMGGTRRDCDRVVRRIKAGLWGLTITSVALLVAQWFWLN